MWTKRGKYMVTGNVNKREEFIDIIVGEHNVLDQSAFEYIIIGASERLRKQKMRNELEALMDGYISTQDDEIYEDELFLESILTFKKEFLKNFIDLLGGRDREDFMRDSLDIYYVNYESRLREEVSKVENALLSLREDIVNPKRMTLTRNS